jgi:hypothetical protein
LKHFALIITFVLSFALHAYTNREAIEERSPAIEKVELVYNVPFVEVYVWTWVDDSCYQVPKVEVVIAPGDITRLVPRLQKKDFNRNCPKVSTGFRRLKIADLDPSLDSSYRVQVLGYYGWHEKYLER